MQRTESAGNPIPDHPRASKKPDQKESASQQQTGFESDMSERASQRNILAIEPLCVTETFSERANRKNLRAEQRKHDSEDHRMNVERDARRDHTRSRQQPKHERKTNGDQRRSRKQEKPIRRVEQHEAQMPPTITKTAQMRRTPALVGPKRDRNFSDLRAQLRSLNHKLRRKLHPRASQIHLVVNRAGESPHAAMAVSDAGMKKEIEQPRKAGIANVFVVPRHRPAFDLAATAISHHDVVALPPHFDEARHLAEVIAVVRIAHDDELPASGCNSSPQSRAITTRRHTYDACAKFFGDVGRSVRRTVVRNDNLAAQSSGLKRVERLSDANPNRIGLVKARDHNRHIDGLLRGRLR